MFKKPTLKLAAEEDRKLRIAEARKHYNQLSQPRSKNVEPLKPSGKTSLQKAPQFTEFRKPATKANDYDAIFKPSGSSARPERFQSLLPKQLSSIKSDQDGFNSGFRRTTGRANEDDLLFKPKFTTPRPERYQSLLPKELANIKLDGDYAAMFREINSARKIRALLYRAIKAHEKTYCILWFKMSYDFVTVPRFVVFTKDGPLEPEPMIPFDEFFENPQQYRTMLKVTRILDASTVRAKIALFEFLATQ